MSLFVFDTDTIAKQLLPPVLRGKNMIMWLKALLKPLQWIVDRFLTDFSFGSNYPYWQCKGYTEGDIITWRSRENFMCVQTHDNAHPMTPTGSTKSALYWLKVQDNFIGLDERITYNAQIIKLTQQLNHWFRVTGAYVQNAPGENRFLMDNESGDGMVNNSLFSSAYMCETYAVGLHDFTVYVPNTAFVPLNSTVEADQKKIVRQFVDKYKVPGTNYDVVIFIPPPPPLPPTTPSTA